METKAIMSIAAILAAFGAGFWLADTLAAKEALDERMELLQAEKVMREDMDRRVNLIDAEHFKELSNAKSENDKLRRDLAAGTKRVRVSVRDCKATATASVDDATSTAELLPADAENIFRITGEADQTAIQLKALQDWAIAVSKGDSSEPSLHSTPHLFDR